MLLCTVCGDIVCGNERKVSQQYRDASVFMVNRKLLSRVLYMQIKVLSRLQNISDSFEFECSVFGASVSRTLQLMASPHLRLISANVCEHTFVHTTCIIGIMCWSVNYCVWLTLMEPLCIRTLFDRVWIRYI